MKSVKSSQPKIHVPIAYRQRRRLVAIPEDEYRAFLSGRQAIPLNPPIVFTKRPLKELRKELSVAYPDDPNLVADVIAGLKRSSVYAKRPAATA